MRDLTREDMRMEDMTRALGGLGGWLWEGSEYVQAAFMLWANKNR